jgi:hypothetical protein
MITIVASRRRGLDWDQNGRGTGAPRMASEKVTAADAALGTDRRRQMRELLCAPKARARHD